MTVQVVQPWQRRFAYVQAQNNGSPGHNNGMSERVKRAGGGVRQYPVHVQPMGGGRKNLPRVRYEGRRGVV